MSNKPTQDNNNKKKTTKDEKISKMDTRDKLRLRSVITKLAKAEGHDT